MLCNRHADDEVEQDAHESAQVQQDVMQGYAPEEHEAQQLEVHTMPQAEPIEPRQMPLQVQLLVQGQKETGAEAGNDEGTGIADTCPLAAFIAKISAGIETTVLGTPATAEVKKRLTEVQSVRRSARIAKVHKAGVTIETLAKEAVAKRLGSLPPTASFSERLLQAYLALFDGPLSEEAIIAIEDLVRTFKKTKRALPVLSVGSGRAGRPSVAV